MPMRMPSHPAGLPIFASRLSAMLNVMMLPCKSNVSFMTSKTFTVSSSSPHTSQVFTTVLNTATGGFSALPSAAKVTQSSKIAVALRLFSFLQQVDSTRLHTLVAGVKLRLGINSSNLTANFQLSSSHALPIALLWMSVHALCAAELDDATRSSPLSGAHPSAFAAAVKRRRPNAKLSIFSAAITPLANSSRPVSTAAMLSSSYPAALAYVRTCNTSST
mmetsp:Transcript_1620/g.2772  ORF Transcript_1620/g.2772 Transcript_1620/m.2772 type:complete len:219 (-) Transcript_1620:1018-1674(-)